MHGRSRGNVMILRANRAVARFFPYSFFPFSFPLLLPPPLLLRFFGLTRASFSPVREIKQLKSAFAIRRKKQRRVSVYSRLFYRNALRHTWDLAVFHSFSFEDR